MDLGAFMFGENKMVSKYVRENFGVVPHYRGVRFMKFETPQVCKNRGAQSAMFAQYCGQDVIYFHIYDDGTDNKVGEWCSNYCAFFLNAVQDQENPDYKDYYFRAPQTPDYEFVCNGIKDGEI